MRFGETLLHTALDDLESFIWVALWTMLERCLDLKLTFSPADSQWMDFLNEPNPGVLYALKHSICLHLKAKTQLSPAISRVRPILGAWFEIVHTAQDALLMEKVSTFEEMQLICLRTYHDILGYLLDDPSFGGLPETWEELRGIP